MTSSAVSEASSIKPIDGLTVHKIASGQVVIDLQTAVKELVENSLDAGATSVEVRFKQYGLTSVEVVDNGCGIAEKDWESVGLKHYTSKLSTFEDLSTVRSFGFRGEALSSLCALCDGVLVMTTTNGPMGIQLDLEKSGKVGKKTRVARQRGTTVQLTNIFATLPVRRKELQRNIKREFGKALGLLNAYALGPCAGMDGSGRGVRLSVSNQLEKGQRVVQIKTDGTPAFKASMTALWGPKAMENVVDLDLNFCVPQEMSTLRRIKDRLSDLQHSQVPHRQSQPQDGHSGDDDVIPIRVKGLISKFSVGTGRSGTDRQFFYVNGRPCNLTKVQKAFNEVYRTFNANQAPFVLANFIVPTECCDVNVSPDKRTVFLQSEGNLIEGLKAALETAFAPHRSTFDLNPTQLSQRALTQTTFDSPFSRRLNVKAGALPKSQSLPVPAPSSKDTGKGESRENGTFGRPLFLLDPDQDGDRPLPAEGATRGTAGESGNAMEEGGKDIDKAGGIRYIVDAARMDVDEAKGRPGKKKIIEEPTIVDTTKTAWSQFTRKEKVLEKQATDVDAPEEVSMPAAKKRRVEEPEAEQVATGGPITKVINDEPPKKRSTGVHPLDSLRNRLAEFARAGGQVAPAKPAKEAPVSNIEDEEMLDEVEESESVRASRSGRARRNSLPSIEVIKPSCKVITLPKETWKENRKGRTAVELDQDVVMENPMPSTSSTIEALKRPAGKVTRVDDDDDDDDTLPLTYIPEKTMRAEQRVRRPEVIRSADTASGNVTLSFDLDRLSSTWKELRKKSATSVDEASCESGKVPADAGVKNTNDNESAVCALARVIDKVDFADMEVVGQFNLGFIIIRKRKVAEGGKTDDLFIVDQHASDEKYNFETLQQTTRIESQKLFKPRLLELTAADELVAIENREALQQNGFELQVDEEASAGQGVRLKVTAFPVSKSTEFNMTDLEELINLIRDRPSGKVVRCSKAQAMFAMRACRKSVMIGMPLNKSQMTSIVQHMGTMDQPWNCPHGRPTMRHLIDLCQDGLQKQLHPIDWFSLAGK
ncbi:hypothetical protein AX15_007791 [Amanita polypyramis BW_CC]|nr:hypothetical protein AX15_007791 [Amanita polypyramis BW_CC]